MNKILVLIIVLSVLLSSCGKDQNTQSTKPVIGGFSAGPATVDSGFTSTLSWNITGATSVSIDNGVGDVSGVTSKVVSPTQSTTYTITATNAQASVTASTSVTVNKPQPPPQPKDSLGTGWKRINAGDSSFFNDIFFINNAGFAVGSHIIKSLDGGNNWSPVAIPSGLNVFENIGMATETNAIFVTLNKLVSTHDGGISSNVSTLPDNLSDVFCVNSAVAYAVGKAFWKTTDGGDNWTKLYDFGTSNGYNSLYFINEQTGWVIKQEGLYKTSDGGLNWQRIRPGNPYLQSGTVFFLNTDTGYISNETSIEKTIDGGNSWNTVFRGSNTYHDIYFFNSDVGYITDDKRIFKTTDGGNTWTKEVTLISNTIIELHFTDPNHGWACGAIGTILKYNQ
jgi:photosystem II stability/assembly factor-like uncharacterized protein